MKRYVTLSESEKQEILKKKLAQARIERLQYVRKLSSEQAKQKVAVFKTYKEEKEQDLKQSFATISRQEREELINKLKQELEYKTKNLGMGMKLAEDLTKQKLLQTEENFWQNKEQEEKTKQRFLDAQDFQQKIEEERNADKVDLLERKEAEKNFAAMVGKFAKFNEMQLVSRQEMIEILNKTKEDRKKDPKKIPQSSQPIATNQSFFHLDRGILFGGKQVESLFHFHHQQKNGILVVKNEKLNPTINGGKPTICNAKEMMHNPKVFVKREI